MAEYIARESEREKEGCAQESIDETKNRILKAAGNLIKAEIREQIYTNEYYPSIDDIAAKNLIPNTSFNPIRSKSTKLFGLNVELDHVFGSKWLFDHLARLGFSVTSDEVKLYKQSVLSSSSNLIDLSNYSNCSFAQWSADNVDHNTITLDGKKRSMEWE